MLSCIAAALVILIIVMLCNIPEEKPLPTEPSETTAAPTTETTVPETTAPVATEVTHSDLYISGVSVEESDSPITPPRTVPAAKIGQVCRNIMANIAKSARFSGFSTIAT